PCSGLASLVTELAAGWLVAPALAAVAPPLAAVGFAAAGALPAPHAARMLEAASPPPNKPPIRRKSRRSICELSKPTLSDVLLSLIHTPHSRKWRIATLELNTLLGLLIEEEGVLPGKVDCDVAAAVHLILRAGDGTNVIVPRANVVEDGGAKHLPRENLASPASVARCCWRGKRHKLRPNTDHEVAGGGTSQSRVQGGVHCNGRVPPPRQIPLRCG